MHLVWQIESCSSICILSRISLYYAKYFDEILLDLYKYLLAITYMCFIEVEIDIGHKTVDFVPAVMPNFSLALYIYIYIYKAQGQICPIRYAQICPSCYAQNFLGIRYIKPKVKFVLAVMSKFSVTFNMFIYLLIVEKKQYFVICLRIICQSEV